MANRSIALRPIYRFKLRIPTSPNSAVRLKVMEAGVTLIRDLDSAVADTADVSPDRAGKAFDGLRDRMKSCNESLKTAMADALLSDGVAADETQAAGEIQDIAKHLAALTENLAESHRLALDGDQKQDDVCKLTFRAQMQSAILDFSDTAGTLDDKLMALADKWSVTYDKTAPLAAVGPSTINRAPEAPPPDATQRAETLDLRVMAGAELEPIANCVLVPLRTGEKIVAAARQSIISITPTLGDRTFTQFPKYSHASVTFTVAADGAVFIACEQRWLSDTDSPGKTRRQVIESQGWREVSTLVTHTVRNNGEGNFPIFVRVCRKGESITLVAPGKTVCPMIIN